MIALEHISKAFDGQVILSEISLVIARGERVLLSGASGSGKTTLLRIIAGLEEPDAGRIEVDGLLVNAPRSIVPPHQRGIGVVFQKAALWPHMSVLENLSFVTGNLGKPERLARLEKITQLCGIDSLSMRMPDTLSAGQARRVALARALACDPRYLLMDEPTSNLDTGARETLNQVILDYAAEKQVGLLYISHDATDIEQIGGTRVHLLNGELQT